MIPQCYPSVVNPVTGAREMQVYILSSVSGLVRWTDYIPIKLTDANPQKENTTSAGGYIPMKALSSTSGYTSWVDYVPVYVDASATDAWQCSNVGFIPYSYGKTLDLNFLTSPVPSTVTFTRASNATYFNSSGVLTTAGNNVARLDYDPATLLPRGLLIEEQRTNLLLHSRDMTQAAWTKTDVTAARTQVGIDGTANSACLMTEGSAGTATNYQNVAAVTAGSTLTVSQVFKRGNADWVLLVAQETTGTDGCYSTFNLATGTKAASVVLQGAGTAGSASITNLGGGWYRCTVSCIPNGSYTIPRLLFRACTSETNITRVANATYIVDCAQLEVGAFATSPIITGAATATRSADSASMTGTNFSSWFNASQGTFVVEFDTNVVSTVEARIFQAFNTGFTNILGPRKTTSNTWVVLQRTPSNVDISISGTPTYDVVHKIANSYSSTSSAAVIDGGTVATAGAVSIADLDRLIIGAGAGTSTVINGHIRRLTFYPVALPSATLQSLTA